MPETFDRFVHLADLGDLLSARVAAAVLEDSGIEVRVHGESLGPYPVTVGRMAVTQLWVRSGDVEEASLVMLESEIEHTLGAELRGGSIVDRGSLPMRIGALVLAVALVAAVVRELMRVF